MTFNLHSISGRFNRFGHFARPMVVFLGLCLSGCGGIGPYTVKQDRFDYVEALSQSWKQQMLLNIVKIRYGDTPVFLEVASIISQYSIESQADFRLTDVYPRYTTGNSQSVGGSAKYTDKPTITYSPLTGERFARSLIKPIPPPAILSLIEAGYPIDSVLRVCVNSINGVRNHYGGALRSRHADPEFYPLLERMRKLQASGTISLRSAKISETEAVVMVFRGEMTKEFEEESRFVRKTLKLDPNARELRVVYGSAAKDDREMALQSRSILEILVDMGSYIEVPANDIKEKRTVPNLPEEKVGDKPVLPLIAIHSGKSAPANCFLAVPYRDHWFWIDDSDLRSKSLFTFLMFMFSLTETQGREGAPIVTIPA